MTDHLPECGQFCDGQPPKCRGGDCTLCDEVDCICDRLRACEQRVLDDDVLAAAHHGQKGYEVGFRKGLDAAREAVTASSDHYELCICDECCGTQAALAAIDALREVNTAQ